MRFALDTNVLFYAIDVNDRHKHDRAGQIIADARLFDCIIPAQVLGEFLHAVRRRQSSFATTASELVEVWSRLFPCPPTHSAHIVAASHLATRRKLQFWDSVILTVAADAGAEILLTEDMQDGAQIEGVTVLNPFVEHNHEKIDALFAS